MSPHHEKPHWPTVMMVVIALVIAFAVVGRGDYELELERENAQLRATAAGCRLAAQLREGRP